MTLFQKFSKAQLVFLGLVLFAVLLGIGLRVFDLKESGFFFYDEGLYLNQNRSVLEFIQKNSPLSSSDSWRAFNVYCQLAISSGKSLWYFIIDSRFCVED